MATRKNILSSILEAVRALPPNPVGEIWGTKETAAYLGVSEDEVYRLVNEEGLPFISIGKGKRRYYSIGIVVWVILNQKIVQHSIDTQKQERIG